MLFLSSLDNLLYNGIDNFEIRAQNMLIFCQGCSSPLRSHHTCVRINLCAGTTIYILLAISSMHVLAGTQITLIWAPWLKLLSYRVGKWGLVYSKAKKKNNCCVALKWDFWKSWVGRSENYFFLNNSFKKHPNGPNLGVYSIIFLKKHPIWAKLGAFPTLLFLIFIFEQGRSLRATQHFFGLIKDNMQNKQKKKKNWK